MSILLLVAMIASIITLPIVADLFYRGEARRASRILMRWCVCAVAYLAVLIVVAMLPRETALKTGVPYCDDDVCMSVEGISRTPAAAGLTYRLSVRLFSRANHGPRSAKGASIYLTDDRHRRFLPVSDPSVPPFDVVMQPGGSVRTLLTFNVAPDAGPLFFSAGFDHLQYASFIIGNGDLLHKPRVRFQIN
jgi:hypothetical protein